MVILQSEQWYQVLDAVLCIQQLEELLNIVQKTLSPTGMAILILVRAKIWS